MLKFIVKFTTADTEANICGKIAHNADLYNEFHPCAAGNHGDRDIGKPHASWYNHHFYKSECHTPHTHPHLQKKNNKKNHMAEAEQSETVDGSNSLCSYCCGIAILMIASNSICRTTWSKNPLKDEQHTT